MFTQIRLKKRPIGKVSDSDLKSFLLNKSLCVEAQQWLDECLSPDSAAPSRLWPAQSAGFEEGWRTKWATAPSARPLCTSPAGSTELFLWSFIFFLLLLKT